VAKRKVHYIVTHNVSAPGDPKKPFGDLTIEVTAPNAGDTITAGQFDATGTISDNTATLSVSIAPYPSMAGMTAGSGPTITGSNWTSHFGSTTSPIANGNYVLMVQATLGSYTTGVTVFFSVSH
jgi:hypothetical protein